MQKKSGYKFITMKNPLAYPVSIGSKEVIPAGAKRVRIAFGQSHLVRNIDSGTIYPVDFSQPLAKNEKRLNVYQKSWNSPFIHA